MKARINQKRREQNDKDNAEKIKRKALKRIEHNKMIRDAIIELIRNNEKIYEEIIPIVHTYLYASWCLQEENHFQRLQNELFIQPLTNIFYDMLSQQFSENSLDRENISMIIKQIFISFLNQDVVDQYCISILEKTINRKDDETLPDISDLSTVIIDIHDAFKEGMKIIDDLAVSSEQVKKRNEIFERLSMRSLADFISDMKRKPDGNLYLNFLLYAAICAAALGSCVGQFLWSVLHGSGKYGLYIAGQTN